MPASGNPSAMNRVAFFISGLSATSAKPLASAVTANATPIESGAGVCSTGSPSRSPSGRGIFRALYLSYAACSDFIIAEPHFTAPIADSVATPLRNVLRLVSFMFVLLVLK